MADSLFVLNVQPTDMPAAAPYSNSVFVSRNPPVDLTLIFLRVPPLNEEQLATAKQAGGRVAGATVASVTLPTEIARQLAEYLLQNTAAVVAPPAAPAGALPGRQ
jgi:hypothetical protein